MKQSNAGDLADTILCLSVVDDSGRMAIPSKESLANASRLKLWEVWYDFDDALGILMSEGRVTRKGSAYYLTDKYERYVRHLEESIAEEKAERLDAAQGYDYACGGM